MTEHTSATPLSAAPATTSAQEAQEIAYSLADQAQVFLKGLLRPWNAYQVGIAIAIFLLAWGLALLLSPRFREWLRTRENWPKWRLRLMLMLEKRLRLVFFVCLLWPTV